MLRHFPNQCLIKDISRSNHIFCRTCKSSYPNIKSSLNAHVASAKHVGLLKKFAARRADDCEVRHFLEEEYYENYPDEQQAGLSMEVQTYRFRVVEAMLAYL